MACHQTGATYYLDWVPKRIIVLQKYYHRSLKMNCKFDNLVIFVTKIDKIPQNNSWICWFKFRITVTAVRYVITMYVIQQRMKKYLFGIACSNYIMMHWQCYICLWSALIAWNLHKRKTDPVILELYTPLYLMQQTLRKLWIHYIKKTNKWAVNVCRVRGLSDLHLTKVNDFRPFYLYLLEFWSRCTTG